MPLRTPLQTIVAHLSLVMAVFLSNDSALATTLNVVTEEGSLQFTKNNRVEGVATDLVRAVLNEAKVKGNIRVYP